MKTLLLLLALTLPCTAKQTVNLAWNVTDTATSYVVYVNNKPAKTVTLNQATVVISSIYSVITVTAKNAGGESPQSLPVFIPRKRK